MTNKTRKAVLVPVLCAVLAGTIGAAGTERVQGAAKPKLSAKQITITKGKSKQVKLKNLRGVEKIKWSIGNKKVAKIKAKGEKVTVTGIKLGVTKLTCRFTVFRKVKKLSCKVLIKAAPPKGNTVKENKTAAPVGTSQPATVQPGNENPVPSAGAGTTTTDQPSPTSSQTPTIPTAPPISLDPIPVKDTEPNKTYDIEGSLKSAYGRFFGNVGTCANIFQIDPNGNFFGNDSKATVEFITNQYNSITPENESKPSRLLNAKDGTGGYLSDDFEPTLISVEDAMDDPYSYVPDNYQEDMCPKINYSEFDTFLKLVAENNMRIRFHAFVWHSQTPKWLFKEDFDVEGDWVTPEIMNARMEYYIKSVIKYICMKEDEMGWGDIVYCYDVANEYFHNNDKTDEKTKKTIKSYWDEVYYPDNPMSASGDYTQVAEPEYVKTAFRFAREMLDQNGRQYVALFYNDYNTYEVSDKIVHLMEYINEDEKLCDGVGMQSHLAVNYPRTTKYGETLRKFLASEAISQVQITELDVSTNTTDSGLVTQDDYYYNLMNEIMAAHRNYPGKITGLTFWGLYDSFSWRRDNRPLLFNSITKAKGVYYSVLRAAAEAEEDME